MTCILAVEHEGKVLMGGDSSALSGWDIEKTGGKVFELGELLIGHSGYARFAQVIEYNLWPPDKQTGDSDKGYVIARLIPAIRECAKQHGYVVTENGAEKVDDALLIGYRGKIYRMSGNFDVSMASRGYAAIGCGADYALGAYAVLDGYEFSDSAFPLEEKIKGALVIAGNFSTGVLPPYYIVPK